ncbi:MAG: F0F1 ATP synthase subunit A [Acidimicrobiales bacterium]
MSAFGLGLSPRLLASDISVGEHVVKKVGGLSVNLDTVWATGAAMVVVIGLGLAMRSRATSGLPGKLQLFWEMITSSVSNQVESSIGPRGASIVPLAISLFVFILVANFFEALGLGSKYEWLAAPTGDINLPLAMAIFVIVLVHIASIRTRGLKGYFKHYFQPFAFLFPINVVEELTKPITLALRLFGNLLSGGLLLALIAALGVWEISRIPIGSVVVLVINPVWKLFDLFIGAIQAFIFALLTILYFEAAMSEAH